MRAHEFVLETLAHYVREGDGPPPGIPGAVETGFETRVTELCARHGLAPVVAASLDRLALAPSLSSVTAARLRTLAEESEVVFTRQQQTYKTALAALAADGIDALAIGEAWAARELHPVAMGRTWAPLQLLVAESDVAAAVACLGEEGFKLLSNYPDVVLDNEDDEAGSNGEDALRLQHYFTPLILADAAGVTVQLRSRVIDFGPPERIEYAWRHTRDFDCDGVAAQAASDEDQLVYTVIEFARSGFRDLGAVADAGLLLARGQESLDWGYAIGRARIKGMYAAFYGTLDRICMLMHMPRAMQNLDPPPLLRRRMFEWIWRPGDVDYIRGEPKARRFMFALAECDGLARKADWAVQSINPEHRWLESMYGTRPTPWQWLRFMADVRRRSPVSSSTPTLPAGTGDARRDRSQ